MFKKNLLYIGFTALGILFVGYFLALRHLLPIPPEMEFFFVVTFAALIDSVNPCAFSILFLTVAFLFSMGKTRAHIIKTGLMYIFGIAFTYIMIGLGILRVLSFFNVPNGMAKIGALILVVFGTIALINEFFPSFPIKLKIPARAYVTIGKVMEKASIPSAFVLGIFVGIFEFPCTGGPYLLVLGLLHDSATFWKGLTYLIWYNVVFVAPLFVALLIAATKSVAEKLDAMRKQETKKARLAIAVIMIALGLVIFLV